ncbi:Beta-1,4-mannosyl-glyco 4-beta-N-acetylglucosaminyltransferase [Fusarium agapanthi]|uniref:Beta-1,4-mannosyl-glyco 4-beta-N-acetylglucosaminyltransferase n=1 Tax=Fusarium agapanthi TaxID=1803897 RepID=A0A9P5B7R1_9HYPO|nr:Beta-1,4-mannosyl-glyco 4-beta-N-acetylglucosaminyltransferase [Fusarium agapanthi]
MSASPPSGSSKRRVRTEAQMSQKRLADRVKHRENRQEHKQRMERMEADIAQIRKNLDTVSAQLRTLPQLSADLVALQQRSSQKPPGEAYEMDTSVDTPDFPAGRRAAPAGAPCSADHHDIPPAEVPEVVSSLFPAPSHVDCRCGVQHHSQADCLEYRSFAILYETHSTFPKDPLHARSLPRNPELPNMTLHSYGDNAVTCFLTSFLKGFEMASVETLFGVYFFAYRLMRWRLHPDPMTLKDVPPWLLPTDVQNTYPHPVSIDYIPWPDLRDFLCTNPRIKSRHSVKIYLESLQLKWPPGCPLMAVEGGHVCVNMVPKAVLRAILVVGICSLLWWTFRPLRGSHAVFAELLQSIDLLSPSSNHGRKASELYASKAAHDLCSVHGYPAFVSKSPSSERKVYDKLMINDELDFLEIRLDALYDYADYFIIVESAKTLQANLQRVAPFDQVMLSLDGPRAPNKGDVLIVADFDEIPRPQTLFVLRYCNFPRRLTLSSKFYYYSFQLLHTGPEWQHPQATYYQGHRTLKPTNLLNGYGSFRPFRFLEMGVLSNAGWHCSSCFPTIDQFLNKMASFSHRWMNHEEYRDKDKITTAVREGKDLWGREQDRFQLSSQLNLIPSATLSQTLRSVALSAKEPLTGENGYLRRYATRRIKVHLFLRTSLRL